MYRILQIEDLPSDAYLVKREIKKVLNPCEFQVVDEKDDFIKALMEFNPHLIVSDMSIPGFSWKTALLLAMEHAPQTPFIVVTGSTSEELRNECMNAGATGFVSKNVIQELGSLVLAAVNARSE
jgi:DNA-binding NarL/FixJ family response regulator